MFEWRAYWARILFDWMVHARYAAQQWAPSVALDRTGRPSRDLDPPAPGRLLQAPLLGMARADAVRLATAVSACVASEGGRRRQGPVIRPRRRRHAVPVARPDTCRATGVTIPFPGKVGSGVGSQRAYARLQWRSESR